MDVIRSLAMAFSCFSRIPMPRVEWRDSSMRFMLCFFPLVGAVVGGLVWLWLLLCDALEFGALLRGAGVALVPVAVTGGIHLDGLADVADAQASHAEPARKREILKDPHAGAFAVIALVSYLVAYVALASELADDTFTVGALLVGMHVASRVCSGIATATFPKNAGRGMLAQFHDSADRRVVAVLVVWGVAVAGALVLLQPAVGTAMVVVALACLGVLAVFARTQFGGMSGDLAGWFLQVVELAMLACLVVGGKLVGL